LNLVTLQPTDISRTLGRGISRIAAAGATAGAGLAHTGPVILSRGISGMEATTVAGIGMAIGPVIMGRGISATKKRPPPQQD